jgi:hypothetical protein
MNNYNNIIELISHLFYPKIQVNIEIFVRNENHPEQAQPQCLVELNRVNSEPISIEIYTKIVKLLIYEFDHLNIKSENIIIYDDNFAYDLKNDKFTYSSIYGKIFSYSNEQGTIDEDTIDDSDEKLINILTNEYQLSNVQINQILNQGSNSDSESMNQGRSNRFSYLLDSDAYIDPANGPYEQTQFYSGKSDIEPE